MKRVERMQEPSKTSISVMVCGKVAKELLPPFVVYKAQNLYENWTSGGPQVDGSIPGHLSVGFLDLSTPMLRNGRVSKY